MSKKGQITIYIVLAIVLISAIFAYYSTIKTTAPIESAATNINARDHIIGVMQPCLKQKLSDAISIASSTGGWTNKADAIETIDVTDGYVGIGGYMGVNVMLDSDGVAKQISKHIESTMRSCAQQTGASTIGTPHATTTITSDRVMTQLDYPVTVINGQTSITVEQFSAEIPTPFGQMANDAYDIVDAAVNDIQHLQTGELQRLPYKSTIEIYGNTQVYTITTTDGRNRLRFAVQNLENLPPYIPPLGIIYTDIGRTNEIDPMISDPNGDDIHCATTDPRFTITSSCKINFLPREAGTYRFDLIAIDSIGNTNQQEVTVMAR